MRRKEWEIWKFGKDTLKRSDSTCGFIIRRPISEMCASDRVGPFGHLM